MLLRVADQFGVKVKSLQHVLEGYKVAPEIAAHGASCQPVQRLVGVQDRGVRRHPVRGARCSTRPAASVCLKSDGNELMRHLYQEAAKLRQVRRVHDRDEALQTITLNPAKQLGLDKRLGTIEVGKDADLAIFNGHPLNCYARCEMTLVEGEVYFQRSEKLAPSRAGEGGPDEAGREVPGHPRTAEAARTSFAAARSTSRARPAFVGTVVVDAASGKITQVVGANEKVDVPADATVVDCTGLHLYPGMIDAGTVLGLVELDSATRDATTSREGGDFQPDLRASVGINPDSELIPVTRANGVTDGRDAADRLAHRRAGGADQPGRLGAGRDGRRRSAGAAHRVPGEPAGVRAVRPERGRSTARAIAAQAARGEAHAS